MDDEDLIEAYYACDTAAMDQLCQRYYPRLLGYFRNSGLSSEDAEDQTQEVFLRVPNTKQHLWGSTAERYRRDGGAAFRTWLFRIAVHRLATTLRRHRLLSLDDLAASESHGAEQRIELTITARDLTPEEQAWLAERRQAVRDCLARLPARERLALGLWLETEGEMVLADLADALEQSIPTAHRVLGRAFHLLRECLLRTEEGPPAPGPGGT